MSALFLSSPVQTIPSLFSGVCSDGDSGTSTSLLSTQAQQSLQDTGHIMRGSVSQVSGSLRSCQVMPEQNIDTK